MFTRSVHASSINPVYLVLAGGLTLALAACAGSSSESRDRFVQAGDQAIGAGQVREAVIAYRNAVQIDPVHGDARLRLADALSNTGDAHGALGEYIRAADLKPDDFDLQVKTGNLLVAVGKLADAKTRAEGVLKKNPSHVEAHILLGNSLGGYQDLEQALAQMEEAIRLDPSRAGSHLQLAVVQQAQGKNSEAETALKKAIELAPKWPGGYLALGNFYWSVGRLPEATAAIDSALALEPMHAGANRAKAMFAFVAGRPAEAEAHLVRLAESSSAPQPKITLGDYYLAMGKLPEAVAVFEQLSKDLRNGAAVTPRLVRAYASAGNKEAARSLVKQALQQNAGNHAIRTLESQLLLDEGRREEALASARSAAEGDPGSALTQFTLGKAYAAIGDRSGAEAAFREVLKINPRATPAQVELSLLRLGEKGGTDSLRTAEEAAAARPGSPEARLALVRSLLAAGNLARAEQELVQLQTQKPTAAGYVQAGGLAMARNDFAKARTAFNAALELSPGSIEAFAGQLTVDLKEGHAPAVRTRLSQRLSSQEPTVELLLVAARTYLALNDLKDSEAVLRRAIDLEPASLPAYSMLGQTYLRLGRLDDARAEFDRLASRQSRPVGALTASGTILQAQGKAGEARERYERAIGIDPGAAVAANNLAWIYAESGEHLDRAVALAESALKRLPDVPDVLDTLGWAYYKSNSPAMAVGPLSRCVTLAPTNAGCHYHLGLAHAKLGDAGKAEQSLRSSIRLGGNAPWLPDANRVLATLSAAK